MPNIEFLLLFLDYGKQIPDFLVIYLDLDEIMLQQILHYGSSCDDL